MSSAARSGTLEEGQVRAMFDRIAGAYDVMNSVMTAGLHHRWRERAADLAQLRRGDRALDVATGTGDLAMALARRVGPEGEVIGSDFSEGMLARARAKAPELRWEHGNALGAALRGRGASTRRRSASGRATSPTSSAGSARWRASCGPGGRVVVLEITTPTRPPLSTFFSLWFDRVVPRARAAARPSRRPTPTCRARSSASRGPRRWPGCCAAAGLRDVRWILTAGGIIALHAGTVAS